MNDENEFPDLPEGVGPHEERELELMLAGKKPLAMFYEGVAIPVSEVYPEEDFMPYVESGLLIRRDEIYQPHDGSMAGHYVYYALSNEVWRFDEIHRLQHACLVEGQPWTEDHDRKLGQLLGYTENEISA